jgi:hypothetical protein
MARNVCASISCFCGLAWQGNHAVIGCYHQENVDNTSVDILKGHTWYWDHPNHPVDFPEIEGHHRMPARQLKVLLGRAGHIRQYFISPNNVTRTKPGSSKLCHKLATDSDLPAS